MQTKRNKIKDYFLNPLWITNYSAYCSLNLKTQNTHISVKKDILSYCEIFLTIKAVQKNNFIADK